MVLQMKVEAVNFRKSQEISLLWLDCYITKFRNKPRGVAHRSPPGLNRVKNDPNVHHSQKAGIFYASPTF